jgi:hypothetical protein
MRNYLCAFIILLLHQNIFANEGIKIYMVQNNMNYPYNISQNINGAYFVDFFSGELNGDVLENIELTNEQKNIMIPFFEKLEKINIPECFVELKKQSGVIAFSIDMVYLFRESLDREYIHVGIWFYCDRNIGGHSRYNKKYNFWEYYNIALYTTDDYKFLGFHF